MNTKLPVGLLAVLAVSQIADISHAQTVYKEDFTGATTANDWYFFNGACLTAGTSTVTSGAGSVPACTTVLSTYYSKQKDQDQYLVGGDKGYLGSATKPASISAQTADPVGKGALRLTNGWDKGHNESGAIISEDTFATDQGVQITFKTVTYRGDSGGAGKDGADGISFFLMDGSVSPNIGAFGGSLGYSCSNSNTPHDGIVGGYIGLGIDEYGNFLNGTSLMPGYTGTNVANGDNSALGYGYKPGRIGMRGAGSVAWSWLNKNYPSYYPSTLTTTQQQDAVDKTCTDGVLYDYSNANNPKKTSTAVLDYAPIPNAYKELSGIQIANESATTRSDATAIFYNLKITQDGLLSLSYSTDGSAYQAVIKNQSIASSNGTMPSSFRFGFAGSTGGSTNVHELMCFKAAPATQSGSSTTVNEKQASKLQEGAQAYFAFYNPNNWTGKLTANPVLNNKGVVTVATQATWDSSCVLTGVLSGDTCDSTGKSGPVTAESPTSRVMLTWNGSAGVAFQWGNLSSSQKNSLDSASANSSSSPRLDYLRGVRTNEIDSSGKGSFRERDSVLSDIVDSSPVWVGPPSSPYTATWKDRLYTSASVPENSSQTYSQFVSSKKSRLNVVYVGANDGFLHGFRTGSYDSSGNFVAGSNNDGLEVLAYMPAAVLNVIHNSSDSSLDFSDRQYGHNFYVDATPGTGDLYYGSKWHTWLVGGLGAGGKAIYALDITDPSRYSETGSVPDSPKDLVIGEWDSSSITCQTPANCGNSLGNTFGTPQIRRLHNGKWAVIFGNGFGSVAGDAGIFIIVVDPTSPIGATTNKIYYLSAGNAGSNGIAYVTPADLDGDHITDYVYAGDLKGNVWRFDLTSNLEANWKAPKYPLFTTASNQPITSQLLAVETIATVGMPQMLIEFGTGQRTQLTNTTPVKYATGTQSIYGVWDWNLSAWNTLAPAAKYASLDASDAATGLSPPYTLSNSNLQKQTFTINSSSGLRDGTSVKICWQGYTLCSSGNNKFGWYADLPGSSEQVIYNPTIDKDSFIVNSTVPANNVATSCTTTTDTGFTYMVSLTSGGVIPNAFPNYNEQNLVGVNTNATGTPSVVRTQEGTTTLIYQTVTGDPGWTPVQIPPNLKAKRLTWVELR